MSTTKCNELNLVFVVAPLDDLCDSKTAIMSKWQVKEAMHNLIEQYVEQLMEEGEWATVLAAGKKHTMDKRDLESK